MVQIGSEIDSNVNKAQTDKEEKTEDEKVQNHLKLPKLLRKKTVEKVNKPKRERLLLKSSIERKIPAKLERKRSLEEVLKLFD